MKRTGAAGLAPAGRAFRPTPGLFRPFVQGVDGFVQLSCLMCTGLAPLVFQPRFSDGSHSAGSEMLDVCFLADWPFHLLLIFYILCPAAARDGWWGENEGGLLLEEPAPMGPRASGFLAPTAA